MQWHKSLPLLAALAVPMFSQQTATDANGKVFENRCSICHGGDANGGGRAPSILAFARYHTDAEISDVIRNGRADKGMPAFQISGNDLHEVIARLRGLAGSDPAMATGGLTGEGLKRKRGRKPLPGPRHGEIKLDSGATLSGTILNEDDFSTQISTADGQLHLLSRVGDRYHEKPIEPKANWTTYNGSLSGNRYSPLEQINSSTVSKLSLDWLFAIRDTPRIEATPVVVDGVMYVTSWNELYAVDATTGRQLWMYHQAHTPGLMSEAGKGANRGVAVEGDKVFMVTDDAHLLAFNRKTGEKCWDVEMAAIKDGYSATGAPLAIGRLVIVGVSGGEEGARGFVDAYKSDSGEHAWRFYTIPKRGEKGSETWIGSAIDHGCGATWLTGSYDPALDLVYWTTGNPCPDFNGDERKGDNLYTDSVVALSAKTGQLKWHFQFTPHDVHDWDAVQPLLLLDQPWQGRPRKLLLHADRNGFYFVFDRTNGELLAAKAFVKVNWTTGYGKDGRPIVTDRFDSSKEGTLTCPASSGGTNWFSNSWSPMTHLFYLRTTDWCGTYKKHDDPLVENRWYGGVTANEPGAENFIRALDINTGKKIWEFPLENYGRGGILSTAGGLVFFASPQGAFVALDATSGKESWHVNLGQDWQASPMTYMVGGKQYIALSGAAGVFAFALHN